MLIFATSPQAKGRIERMWNTFQDRLIPELRIHQIQTIPAANSYLKNKFIPNFNRSFSVPPASTQSGWKEIPEHLKGRLDEIFCMRFWRRVTNGDTVQIGGKTYRVDHPYDYSLRGMQIEIRTALDGAWSAYHANRVLSLTKLDFLKKRIA